MALHQSEDHKPIQGTDTDRPTAAPRDAKDVVLGPRKGLTTEQGRAVTRVLGLEEAAKLLGSAGPSRNRRVMV